jgi:hypothetical protein
MKSIFKNDILEILLDVSTNEVHIRALKTENTHRLKNSLRAGVYFTGFDLTSDNIEYIPILFNGLAGFKIITKNTLINH